MPHRIHLVTYATRRFRLRQMALACSARLNGIVDTVTCWNPDRVHKAGFAEKCPSISLEERGSGFWAWKPFIIQRKLAEVPDGDLVFYCDVGRNYPFKLLDQPVTPYLDWMHEHEQEIVPGLLIPWKGPMSMWTKREAFIHTDTDRPEIHSATPIQTSFSFWKASPSTRRFAAQWLEWCGRRELISDDPSPGLLPELADFHEHRHDQSLLSILCVKSGVSGIDIGTTMPDCDTQHPDHIAAFLPGGPKAEPTPAGRVLRQIIRPFELAERNIRKILKFGHDRPEPPAIEH